MNNSWNNQHFQQQPQQPPGQVGQVKLFDPTQFQTPAASASGPAVSKQPSGQVPPQHPVGANFQPQQPSLQNQWGAEGQGETQGSWSNWGGWDGWNGNEANVTGHDPQQFPQPSEHLPPQPLQQHYVNSSHNEVVTSQYQQDTSDGNNTNVSYAGGGQYTNAWDQSWDGSVGMYAQPNQMYPNQGNVAQPEQAYYGQPLPPQPFYGNTANQEQQGEHAAVPQPDPNASHLPNQGHAPSYSEQGQPSQEGQSFTDGGQSQVFYDQPTIPHEEYDPSSFVDNGPWLSSASDPAQSQPNVTEMGGAVADNVSSVDNSSFHYHEGRSVDRIEESSSSANSSATGNSMQLGYGSPASQNVQPNMAVPSLDVYTDNDGDGTVAGFFSRGDDDGDVPSESSRLPRSGAVSESHNVPPQNNPGNLLAVDKSIVRTNSEISNASLTTLNTSAEDDGREHLQNLQELVERMENVDLANQIAKEDHRQGLSQQLPVSNMEPSGFAVPQPPNLPLDTELRSASPDLGAPESAESGGSGASGGSSGLTDWEIVPSQSSQLTHSRSNSLDNNVNIYSSQSDNHSDRPSGEIKDGGMDHRSIPLSSSASHESVPQSHPLPLATQDQSLSPGKLLSQSSASPANPPPMSSAFSSPSMPPVSGVSGPGENPFRRGGPSANPALLVQPSLSSAVTAGVPVLSRATYSDTGLHLDSKKPKSIPSLPSKPKLPSDDGAPPTKENSSTKSSELTSNTAKQSSRPSDEDSLSAQRRHQSAFHPVHRPRQNTVSPATTLWDNSDNPSSSNILLAPAMPLIIPALNPYSSSAAAIAATDVTTNSNLKKISSAPSVSDKGRPKKELDDELNGRYSDRRGDRDRASGRSREREDVNRSIDSLDELDVDSSRDRSYRGGREPKSARDVDRPSSRSEYANGRSERVYDRPGSRADRPSSRNDSYRDDGQRRHRNYYRDYGNSYYDERYDRPRSRQADEQRGSRPSSRSGQDVDRPRSRTEYEREADYYYRDRNRGYQDSYGRQADYYGDDRERYQRYYKEKEARYSRGYYEEYYGAKHAEYYQQQQQKQRPQEQPQSKSEHGSRPGSRNLEGSGSRSQSRGHTPGVERPNGHAEYYQQQRQREQQQQPQRSQSKTEHDSRPGSRHEEGSGSKSQSRGNTPGVERPNGDYYARGSRPPSRMDYGRDYYSRGYAYDGYAAHYDGYAYDPYYGYVAYPGYEEPANQAYDQGRMTPPKYSYPHVRACFGPNGLLVKVLPNRPADGQPAMVELQDVQSVLENCRETEELQHFPGPLSRVNTHKKDVLYFCQQKARACMDDVYMVNRESAQLIWKFLELLIKQNGVVVGTDLSELLLEGHEPASLQYSLIGDHRPQSAEGLEIMTEDSLEGDGSSRNSPAIKTTMDRTLITPSRQREDSIARFRHLLLYGRKKDALECAMKNNLWGHALFLASKMDTRTHGSVMIRFANSAMKMNDPLQTLYQLMSGRQPASVTGVMDERWGDWRPHLAMILSNQSARQELDRKSITILGDTLASKGYLHASHFCYLMAQVSFGSYQKKTSKIVLIGANQYLALEEFASPEAIQCTEIYEYAQSLNNPGFCLVHFQIFKYLYACKLADHGMAAEAHMYCEVIATAICRYPTYFQPSFVKLVHELSSKLKYADTHRQHVGEDAEDSQWMHQLNDVLQGFENGSIQPTSGTQTPALNYPGSRNSSDSREMTPYQPGETTQYPSGEGPVSGVSSYESTGFDPYAQQQYQEQQQQQQAQAETDYQTNNLYQQGDAVDAVTGHQGYGATEAYQQQHQQQFVDPSNNQQVTPQDQQQPQQQQHYQQQADYNSQWQQQQQQQQQQYGHQTDLTSSQTSSTFSHMAPGTGSGDYSTNDTEDEEDDDDDDIDGVPPVTGFDYFGSNAAQKVVTPPHRYRTASQSSTGSTRRRRTISGSSTGSVKASPKKTANQSGKDLSKRDARGGAGEKGWLGNLFSKFGRNKDQKEMILPDDKDPTIVWDPVKKKWIDGNEPEKEEVVAAPPPRDIDLMGKSAAPSASVPAPPAAIPGGANRFSLKAKGARNQYVDVNNPKPVSVPQSLFNVMPTTTASSTIMPQVMLPGAAPQNLTSAAGTAEGSEGMLNLPPAPLKDTPDPSQQATAASAPAPMPFLFNPASLNQNTTGGATTSAGPGLKYGQRRAYPK